MAETLIPSQTAVDLAHRLKAMVITVHDGRSTDLDDAAAALALLAGERDALARQLAAAEPELFDWYARVAWYEYHRTQTGERSLSDATTTAAHAWVAELRAQNYAVDALFRRPPIRPWQRQEVPRG